MNDLPLLAYLARKIRLEQGLSLENLKSKDISIGTISNIENMEGNPSEAKILALFQRLGISAEQLEEVKEKELLEIELLQQKLECVEDLIKNNDLEQGMKLLKQFQPNEHHALYPYVLFIEGQYYWELRDWAKAERTWKKALQRSKKQKFVPNPDLLPKIYNSLGTVRYEQNDISKALKYANDGLNCFEPEEHNEIKFSLICNKILYLRKSEQKKEALSLTKQVWELMDKIKSLRIKLLLYKSYSILLMEENLLNDALQLVNEALAIVHRNLSQKRFLLDFNIILGSIFLRRNNISLALEYFHLVLELDPNQKYSRRHAEAYTYLTSLYTKQKKWEQAEYCIQKALSIGREIINDDYRLSKILMIAGICKQQQKQFEHAIPFFKEAVKLCEKYRQYAQKRDSIYELASCYNELGNKEAFSKWTKEYFLLQQKIGRETENSLYDIF